MKITPHLTFPGSCRQAFEHYHQLFGGELGCFSYGDSPGKENVPEAWHDKLVHASLDADLCSLSGADLQKGDFEKPQGVFMLLETTDENQARAIFAGLAEGGTVQIEIQETFWSPLYGSLVDQFGIPWEINYVVDEDN